jgi:hypothetical protein
MSKASRSRESRRDRTRNALVAGTLPAAVVAATAMTGASAQAAATPQGEPAAPPHPAHCVKQTVKITWRDPDISNRYLQIKDDSKRNGASVVTAKRNKSTNQEWDAHLTCEFSASGLDLWSFKNVHSSLCVALGPVPRHRVEHIGVQNPCGKHFNRWTFTESPQYHYVDGHRHFLGWVLNLLSSGKQNVSGLELCDTPKSGTYFSPFLDAQAGGGCLWR